MYSTLGHGSPWYVGQWQLDLAVAFAQRALWGLVGCHPFFLLTWSSSSCFHWETTLLWQFNLWFLETPDFKKEISTKLVGDWLVVLNMLYFPRSINKRLVGWLMLIAGVETTNQDVNTCLEGFQGSDPRMSHSQRGAKGCLIERLTCTHIIVKNNGWCICMNRYEYVWCSILYIILSVFL